MLQAIVYEIVSLSKRERMNCSATRRACPRCDERNFTKGGGRPSSSDSAIGGQRPQNLQAVQGRDGGSKASIAFDCRPLWVRVNGWTPEGEGRRARHWKSIWRDCAIASRLCDEWRPVETNLFARMSGKFAGNSHHTIKAPCNAAVKLVDAEPAKMYQ